MCEYLVREGGDEALAVRVRREVADIVHKVLDNLHVALFDGSREVGQCVCVCVCVCAFNVLTQISQTHGGGLCVASVGV